MSAFKAASEPPVVVPRYKIIRLVGRTKELFLLYNVEPAATPDFIPQLRLVQKPPENKVADVTLWSKHNTRCSLRAT